MYESHQRAMTFICPSGAWVKRSEATDDTNTKLCASDTTWQYIYNVIIKTRENTEIHMCFPATEHMYTKTMSILLHTMSILWTTGRHINEFFSSKPGAVTVQVCVCG